MNSSRRRTWAAGLLGIGTWALGRGAAAHTDRPHATPKAGPVAREQKDWGIAGDARDVRRTVACRMLDTMRFSPERVEVRQDETVRFTLHNTGRVLHEFVLGTTEENAKHHALMKRFPNMEHDEPWMAHVQPGRRGEIVWKFNRAGEFEFACLIAGHYEAGMRGRIVVTAAAPPASDTNTRAASSPTASASAAAMTDGEVRKVDKAQGKITLKHGEIKTLDMPPMTMVFQVKDKTWLDRLKPGDKVRFSASNESGRLTVTAIEVQR